MAWTERTLPEDETIRPINEGLERATPQDEVTRLREVFKDMPPFIKLTSRRARKTLAKYEDLKQQKIEALRNNPSFKFVMMVAGLTNEPMEKYWKGDSADPFSDKNAQSTNVKICKEDLGILLKRARENSFADLHQFCTNVSAIPMYRKKRQTTEGGEWDFPVVSKPWWFETREVSDDDSDYDPGDIGDYDSSDDEMFDNNVVPIYRPIPTSNPPTPLINQLWSPSVVEGVGGGIMDFTPNVTPPNGGKSQEIDEPETPARPPTKRPLRSVPRMSLDIPRPSPPSPGKRMPPPAPQPAPRRSPRASLGSRPRIETSLPTPVPDPPQNRKTSKVKYIYNMSDEEFHEFVEIFMKKRMKGAHTIRRYILGRDLRGISQEDKGEDPFPAHSHFRGQRVGGEGKYDDYDTRGVVPPNETQDREDDLRVAPVGRRDHFRRPVNHSVDRIFDRDRVPGEGYDHRDGYVTLKRSNWWEWSDSVPIVRWEGGRDGRPEFWFQRYLARWLTREANSESSNNRRYGWEFRDLKAFKNKYQGLFNNLWFKETKKSKQRREDAEKRGETDTEKQGKWMRNLTGLRLTKFVQEDSINSVTGEKQLKTEPFDDCREVCEVPLDFVKPLFEERFSYWKHELVLGEYEKRAMYAADQWLQKTPWAIGKIYLQPAMFAHMQEAHIAITSRYKKFSHLNVDDWFGGERQRYFFAKLVALCIRTSAVLSNKRYGLDKAYMRLNLEKKRIMYAIGKLEPPQRTRRAVAFPRASDRERDAWQRYETARLRGDGDGAANALRDMNMRHVPSGSGVLRGIIN